MNETAHTHEYAECLATIAWNHDGLVPVIVQQHDTGEVLMMAWMNSAALRETLTTGRMCYWSRSRNALWRKGERSGQTQELHRLTIDCDGDALLAAVNQQGVACHTGRRSCFFRTFTPQGLKENQPVTTAPEMLYGQ